MQRCSQTVVKPDLSMAEKIVKKLNAFESGVVS